MKPTTRKKELASLRDSIAKKALTQKGQAHSELTIAQIERLDHILFAQWDPIGVHLLDGFNCEGEYDSYLPAIVDMVTNNASIKEMTDVLYSFEALIVGEDLRCRRRCYDAATTILGHIPAADRQKRIDLANRCDKCQRRQAPLAHCIDSAGYGIKPSIHYVD